MASIYGSNSSAKRIYGKTTAPVCNQVDTCLTVPTMAAFLSMIESLKTTLDKLFPATEAKAPFVAPMSATGGVPVPIFIRIAWRQRYIGVKFEGTNIQLGQLIDMYIRYGFDWMTDTYIVARYVLPT
jgi:hypothetical protein